MSTKRSSRKKSSEKYRTSPRKRAFNDIDPDFESHYAKKRRLEGGAVAVAIKKIPIEERIFYHMQNLQSYLIDEHEQPDSSDENDYKLLEQSIHQENINRRRDLNDGEKEMMNLWNSFIECQNEVFGIKKQKTICKIFIDRHINDILQKKLYKNCLLHFCTLYDKSELTSNDFMSLVQQMQNHVGINVFDTMAKALQPKPHKRTSEPRKKTSKSPSFESASEPKRKSYVLRSVDSISKG